MSTGRIHCVLIATKAGEVVYERFYDRLSELDKAEIRAAFQLASSNVRLTTDDVDFIGVFRSARFVFIPYGDLVFYLLGSGEYDELAGADILRTYVGLLRDVLGKQQITSSFLLDTRNYMKMVLVLDELINEGILEQTDKEAVRKALKMKAAWE